MANVYKCRPSVLFGIQDIYTAYCFDEACGYISGMIENDNEPHFETKYKSFTDMYRQYE